MELYICLGTLNTRFSHCSLCQCSWLTFKNTTTKQIWLSKFCVLWISLVLPILDSDELQQFWLAFHSLQKIFLVCFLNVCLLTLSKTSAVGIECAWNYWITGHYQVSQLSVSPVKTLVCCAAGEKSYMTANLPHGRRSPSHVSSVRAPVKRFHGNSYHRSEDEAVLSLVSKYIAERHKGDFSGLFWFLWSRNRADLQWPCATSLRLLWVMHWLSEARRVITDN